MENNYHTLTLPLITEKYQEDILNKRFEIGRKIYNTLNKEIYKRHRCMIGTKRYRNIKSELKEIYQSESKINKVIKDELCKELNEIYKEFRFSKFDFQKDVQSMQKHFKDNIDSLTARSISVSLWKTYEELLFRKGRTVHYKRYGEFNALSGQNNLQGIRFKDNNLIWNGLSISIKRNFKNLYESQCFEHDIAFCRIIRKIIRNKYKFYIQIVFKDNPPIKIYKETGELKYPSGDGKLGLDIGTQTIAISSKNDVRIFELADRIQSIEDKIKILQRKMDRSKRAMNPNNYNEDWTIKKQGNKKVIWVKSNHYIKTRNELRELHRKQKDIRKLQHNITANYIISCGDTFYVEKMNYSALQKKSKETKINKDTGRIKSKKRFGKSISNKSPAMFLSILEYKLKCMNKELIKVDTWNVRASQYNHFTDKYNKKKLSQRWNDFNGIKIQRDMYSAFLIMNVTDDLKSINREKCINTFNNFKILHDIEVERLKGNKNLSSIGI